MNILYCLGLIEGEGNFYSKVHGLKYNTKSGPKECFTRRNIFQITMHLRDETLLYKIKDTLDMGNILKTDKYVRYAITNRKDLNRLIQIIDTNGGFEGFKGIQYSEWKKEIIK